MATYNNITTTAAQEKALDWLVRIENTRIAEENVRRAAQTPPLPALPSMTKQQYIDSRLVDAPLNSYLEQYTARVGELVKERYLAATATVKTQVRTLLGVDPDSDI